MSKFHFRLCLIVFIGLFLGTQAISDNCLAADLVDTRIETWYHTDYVPGGEPYRDKIEERSSDSGELLEIQNSGSLREGEGSYEVEAYGKTTYGYNHASARVKAFNTQKEIVVAYAESYFEDDWRIRALNADTPGQVCIGVTIHGVIEGDGNSLSFKIDCDGCDDGDRFGFSSLDDWTGPAEEPYGCFEYRTDRSFTITSYLEVEARIGNYEEEGPVSGQTYIGFHHTAAITKLILPEGHTLETSSGTVYPVSYTPPGTNNNTPTTTNSGGGGGGGCFILTLFK